MNPQSTARLRRLTGLFTGLWAAAAILGAIVSLVWPSEELTLPVHCSFVGGRAMVEWTTHEARAAGIEPGDRLVSVDGISIYDVLRMGSYALQEQVPNRYEFVKADGSTALAASLLPAPANFDRKPSYAVVHLALLLVSAAFLAIGVVVWWNKPERAEGWAMMLFCSMMAIELATSIRVHLQPLSSTRLLANLPLLGAATFHLFTTYPIEPEWIVRHRRIRIVPYLIAFALMGLIGLERMMADAGYVGEVAYFYGLGLSLCSIAIPMLERGRAHRAGIGDRADMMVMAANVSLLPSLLLLLGTYWVQTPLPWYIALLWLVIFPLVVGYGMLRKQLFEFRIMARSSAAYGAATLAITGLFAFMITFADALVSLFGVTVRSVQVAFLFVAILAFDPLRDRLQRLVDQLFDRDRSRYRQAVREISEAMVSMLSLKEISDRILLALTDTMGVGRAMVLLFDETERMLRPSARRGDWDDDDTDIEISAEHPIWRHLWMRREELSRPDFDELTDPESREECWEVYDALEVELLVPILFGVDLLGVIAVGRKLTGERLGLRRSPAVAHAGEPERDRDRERQGLRRDRAAERDTRSAGRRAYTRAARDTQAQLMQSEKLKSLGQLVAGVAHELNNPIGFVHANLQLLDENIAEADRCPGCRTGTRALDSRPSAIRKTRSAKLLNAQPRGHRRG